MTDEELITALRMRAESELCRAAADRIEALVNEWSKDGEEILSLREKVDKLRGALQAVLSTAHADDHVGWHAALEEARAALTTEAGNDRQA